MYSTQLMASQQKPETFMLSNEAQQALPHAAQIALQQAFGRPVKNAKKFEEGIFSDLRNLKAGTDATLEDPKSPFLDFLYKNNCIRTQKKQKVFYWYSVPHDRLFLDALERDLKREKMNQEATTVAMHEPALSFQYDSSQSLYEQLTKAQQVSSSSFNTHLAFQNGTDMPPPTGHAPHMMQQSMNPSLVHAGGDGMDSMSPYAGVGLPQTSMTPPMGHSVTVIKNEHEYGTGQPGNSHGQYTQHGLHLAQPSQQRHTSIPPYALEYSPAPSFVSSQYDDYSNRAISYEPLTPPQQQLALRGDPAYIANDESGVYGALPDHLSHLNSIGNSMGNIMPTLPTTAITGPQLTPTYSPNNVYTVIEGSPTYKQRRRRSSVTPTMPAMTTTPVPNTSTNPIAAPPGATSAALVAPTGSTMIGTAPSPLAAPASSNTIPHPVVGHTSGRPEIHGSLSPTSMGAPYPQKSHSCPIPTCGRLFKRLEHLKRHVRTHTQERPYTCELCQKAFSRSDNLAQHRRTHIQDDGTEPSNIPLSGEEEADNSGEDHTQSPHSEQSYIPTSLDAVANGSLDPLAASGAPRSTASVHEGSPLT